MSFLSYSLKYYENRINNYESSVVSDNDLYEAKQLLKMLDDLIDEGYDELYNQVEEKFCGVTRLKHILDKYGEEPFPVVQYPECAELCCVEVQKLDDCINELVTKANSYDSISNNVILDDIVEFCKWVGYDDDTAYVFLLRDCLLPYIYFEQDSSRELYPWLIGRKFMDYLSAGNYIDDIIRASFFDALDSGCDNFVDFKRFCKEKILGDLKGFPKVTETIKKLLKQIQKKKIVVIESGCYGTFPMLLASLDERVEFKLFTTVPFLADVYKDRIYTRAYEKNRLFETLYSQDKLFEFKDFIDGEFYVSKKVDDLILNEALGEIKKIVMRKKEMSKFVIRNIEEKDHYNVECVIRRAFWNLNMPGCDEHYMVHKLWNDEAYVPEASLVAETNEGIIGTILYGKCRIETEQGNMEVLTFGPLCVEPDLQKSGVGATLLKASMERARECGYKAILICGVPTYYPQFGFKTADTWGITMPDGSNFDAFMGIELVEGALAGVRGKYYEADVYLGDIHDKAYMDKVDEFDKGFPYMEKKVLPHQWR